MQTQLFEIVPDLVVAEEGWADWATRSVKENGWKVAGAAVIAAPIIPVGVGAVAVGAGLVSGVQNGIAWFRGDDTIREVEISEAGPLQDEHGQPLQIHQIYAVHPDEDRSNTAILASDFHRVIVGEQIADLVSFIRSVVCATAINIEVVSERSGGGSSNFFSRFSAKAEGGVTKRHSVELEYDEPELVPLTGKPFWLRQFPEIVAAFKGARKGSLRRTLTVDTTFGLTASLAEQAGMDASWLGKQQFKVEARFI